MKSIEELDTILNNNTNNNDDDNKGEELFLKIANADITKQKNEMSIQRGEDIEKARLDFIEESRKLKELKEKRKKELAFEMTGGASEEGNFLTDFKLSRERSVINLEGDKKYLGRNKYDFNEEDLLNLDDEKNNILEQFSREEQLEIMERSVTNQDFLKMVEVIKHDRKRDEYLNNRYGVLGQLGLDVLTQFTDPVTIATIVATFGWGGVVNTGRILSMNTAKILTREMVKKQALKGAIKDASLAGFENMVYEKILQETTTNVDSLENVALAGVIGGALGGGISGGVRTYKFYKDRPNLIKNENIIEEENRLKREQELKKQEENELQLQKKFEELNNSEASKIDSDNGDNIIKVDDVDGVETTRNKKETFLDDEDIIDETKIIESDEIETTNTRYKDKVDDDILNEIDSEIDTTTTKTKIYSEDSSDIKKPSIIEDIKPLNIDGDLKNNINKTRKDIENKKNLYLDNEIDEIEYKNYLDEQLKNVKKTGIRNDTINSLITKVENDINDLINTKPSESFLKKIKIIQDDIIKKLDEVDTKTNIETNDLIVGFKDIVEARERLNLVKANRKNRIETNKKSNLTTYLNQKSIVEASKILKRGKISLENLIYINKKMNEIDVGGKFNKKTAQTRDEILDFTNKRILELQEHNNKILNGEKVVELEEEIINIDENVEDFLDLFDNNLKEVKSIIFKDNESRSIKFKENLKKIKDGEYIMGIEKVDTMKVRKKTKKEPLTQEEVLNKNKTCDY